MQRPLRVNFRRLNATAMLCSRIGNDGFLQRCWGSRCRGESVLRGRGKDSERHGIVLRPCSCCLGRGNDNDRGKRSQHNGWAQSEDSDCMN